MFGPYILIAGILVIGAVMNGIAIAFRWLIGKPRKEGGVPDSEPLF
jgi:hypothetical protein